MSGVRAPQRPLRITAMFEEAKSIVFISIGTFSIITFLFNFISKNPPKIPGDIYIDRTNIRVYIPFVSVLVLTLVVYFFGGALKRYLGLP